MKVFFQRILQEITKKKIILGTSDAWSMSRSSQWPSVLYWRLSDFRGLPFLMEFVKQLSICRIHRRKNEGNQSIYQWKKHVEIQGNFFIMQIVCHHLSQHQYIFREGGNYFIFILFSIEKQWVNSFILLGNSFILIFLQKLNSFIFLLFY